MAVLPNGTPWPVPPWDAAYHQWRINDAWYSGDVPMLEAIYGAQGSGVRPTHVVRGQAHAGGVLGAVHRMFWGRPTPPGEQRTRLHIPAASDIASLSSDLLFSEPPAIVYGDDSNAGDDAQTRLDTIMGSDQAHAWMAEGGEYAAAFGATALTVVWDEQTADHVWIQPAAADVTVPEFRYGRLTALNLWSEYVDGTTYYRHIERHEPGAVFHTLYQGTRENLGHAVPLQDRPETAGFAELVNSDGLVETGVPYLTAAWWVNMPARSWRKRGVLAEAGRSDYTGGTVGLFDALDETWSSWMRDLELGRARLIVPRAYLESNGRGAGASFDTERSIYSPLDVPGAAGQAQIEQVQFAIRVAEHEQTAQALYRRILASAGYGELDKETNAQAQSRTATEVSIGAQSRERTRDRKALYTRQAFASIARVAMLLDGVQFRGSGGGDYDEPDVLFPPASQQQPQVVAQSIAQLRAAKVLSVETAVRMAHSDWDDAQVSEELARLADEGSVADPTAIGNPVTDPAAAAELLGLPPAATPAGVGVTPAP